MKLVGVWARAGSQVRTEFITSLVTREDQPKTTAQPSSPSSGQTADAQSPWIHPQKAARKMDLYISHCGSNVTQGFFTINWFFSPWCLQVGCKDQIVKYVWFQQTFQKQKQRINKILKRKEKKKTKQCLNKTESVVSPNSPINNSNEQLLSASCMSYIVPRSLTMTIRQKIYLLHGYRNQSSKV